MRLKDRLDSTKVLGRAMQRFLVEQIRDTRLSLKGRPPPIVVARPRLGERLELWWVNQGGPARAEVLAARWHRILRREHR